MKFVRRVSLATALAAAALALAACSSDRSMACAGQSGAQSRGITAQADSIAGVVMFQTERAPSFVSANDE